MASSWFWVWEKGCSDFMARRRKAPSIEQAACRQLELMALPGSVTWTFCVQRCGTKSVYEVEVRQTIERTVRVLGLADGVGR